MQQLTQQKLEQIKKDVYSFREQLKKNAPLLFKQFKERKLHSTR